MNGLLLVARLMLAGVFGVAGGAKFLDRAGTRQSMREFGVPVAMARPLALVLPLAELACSVALIPAVSAWWGSVGALALLLAFTAAILINLARGRTPECHCFGSVHSEPVGWSTVARNAVLIAVALAVVAQGSDRTGPGAVEWLSALERIDAILLALVVSLVGLAVGGVVALTQLLAQNGRLMLRIEAIEAKLGGRAALEAPAEGGLPLSAEAPSFTARDLDGRAVALRDFIADGKPTLLVFSEPGCKACEQTMPDIAGWQRTHDDRLRIIVISRGDTELNRAKAAAHGVRSVLLQTDREVSEAYRMTLTPSAILIKDGLIESAPASGYDAIRALVFANTLPPAVQRGDVVPTLELPDIDGNLFDIASIKGRPAALLFWNPGCGFCQAMLNDLRSWERTKPRYAPELVVVTTGSLAVNREQRLRSRTLIDSSFGTGKVFGVTGTPSAVLVDAHGRVASEVGVGAPAAFEVLGRQVERAVAAG